jgi:hypothetical protein
MRKRRRKARVAGLPSGRFIGGAGASRPSHQAVGDVDSADVRPYEEEGVVGWLLVEMGCN